jgi:hypothetical protein
MRVLPPHPLTETSTDIHEQRHKTRSRRFPTKVMFQGIVSQPYPEHNFNCQIMLKRVSKLLETKKYHTANHLGTLTMLLTC